MKKPKRYLATYLWTLPFDVVMWLVVIAVRLTCGSKLQWCEGLWCELTPKALFARKWGSKWAAITLGHAGIYGPGKTGLAGIDTSTETHEHVHVEQYETAMLTSFVVGIIMVLSGSVWWACIAVWLSGWAWSYVASILQAWFRGEKPYRGSHLEEAAYSQQE